MWELPLCVFFVCITFAFQVWIKSIKNGIESEGFDHETTERIDELRDRIDSHILKLNDFKSDFSDYKKRVDTLTLKAGFKI